MSLTYTPKGEIGFLCPDFQLPAAYSLVGSQNHSLADFKNGSPLVVMFICNHCPYVKAIEDRLIQLGTKLKNINVNLVAICSNDSKDIVEDRFENLKKRAEDKKYSFPYLHDPDQSVAKAFDAVCTPDFFVFNSDLKLAYRGRLDNSWKDASLVTSEDLWLAVQEIKTNKSTAEKQIPSMGCNIKWMGHE